MSKAFLSLIYCSLFVFGSLYNSSILTVCATPTPEKAVTPMNHTIAPRRYETRPPKQPAQKAYLPSTLELYMNQDKNYKRYQTWMVDFYPLEVTNAARQKYFRDFSQYLGVNLAIDNEMGKMGIFNAGVYRFKGVSGARYSGGYHPDQLLIKVLSKTEVDKDAYGEVIALSLVEQYVNSGIVSWEILSKETDRRTGKVTIVKEHLQRPTIIMKKVNGVPIEKTDAWRRARTASERKRLVDQVERLVEPQVLNLVDRYGLLYTDPNKLNILVGVNSRGIVEYANLIDFGAPAIIFVNPRTDILKLKSWFRSNWSYFWH
ncbi:hypothetical protein J3R30DRAFT_1618090 [Lentinula aciculospora]|uniref:Protein kinase domain-containing protein n=1 Tax=Lentinula aciculospora TaxID=153920 RepID=A0A9W9DG51_9AGAR|nr:hypothetical protein J3R30DRAFT_1618090 [Lentinula aciculospora]